jgi:hypothetical protein
MLSGMGPSTGARVAFSVLLIASTGLVHRISSCREIPQLQARTASEQDHG